LGVDVHTAHADVAAELAALRETAVGEATQLRTLELERLDEMTSGLWQGVRDGNPPAVTAAIRVAERRAKLVGLDEPTKTEISGSLSVDAERRLKAETEDLQRWLTFEELRELGEKSERLFADARALVEARRTPVLVAAEASPVAPRADVEQGELSAAVAPSDLKDETGAETARREP
jgi:hypothetical protein